MEGAGSVCRSISLLPRAEAELAEAELAEGWSKEGVLGVRVASRDAPPPIALREATLAQDLPVMVL